MNLYRITFNGRLRLYFSQQQPPEAPNVIELEARDEHDATDKLRAQCIVRGSPTITLVRGRLGARRVRG